MQIVNFSEASLDLEKVFNTVYFDNEAVVMHKANGQNVVVITFDEYNSMKETGYLFSSAKNKEHLVNSLRELRAGRGIQRDIVE